MADDPANPGAAAVILWREVTTDDVKGMSTEYQRIKVFTDEGKKYADIEIPYVEHFSKVEDIQARTIRPDGTTVDFQGQIFRPHSAESQKDQSPGEGVRASRSPERQHSRILLRRALPREGA